MGKGFISTHDVLLYLLDQLPEEESAELRVELKAIYADLVAQLELQFLLIRKTIEQTAQAVGSARQNERQAIEFLNRKALVRQ